jgi:two-component system, cell cycle response regulator DivK
MKTEMALQRGKKILIIDDDARNIFALRAVLKSRGYECISASNAIEGLTRISNENEIGVILLDMMMPEMDGYEMLPLIRSKSSSRIPVIAVTAQAMFGDREKCLEAGADAYISKPIDLDSLLALLTLELR